MAAIIFGVTGATFGLTAETGGLIQSLKSTSKVEKEVTKNEQGESARVTYYDPTTEVEAEWVPTGATGISAAAVAAELTGLSNTMLGSGKILVEEISVDASNTADARRSFKATRYPLIT